MKITKINLILIIILLAASLLRFYNLTSIALWHDEAFSALLIRYPVGEMMHRIALDVHPPLYYLVLRVWDIILGDSLLSLRFFSAFFGILTVYFAYLFIRDAFKNERLALIAAAFIAVNPFQIQYSVESRMYTLGTFLIILSSWLLIKAIESLNIYNNATLTNACKSSLEKCDWLSAIKNQKPELKNIFAYLKEQIKKYAWWILYGLSVAAAIYTHYYLLFSVAAQGMFILFWVIKNNYLKIKEWIKTKNGQGTIIIFTTILLLLRFWFPKLINQSNQVRLNDWINWYPLPDYILFPVTIFIILIVYWTYKNYNIKIKEWTIDRNIKGSVFAYLIAFILFIPWFSTFKNQLGQVTENYWIPAMDRYSIPNTIFHLFAGSNFYTSNLNLIIFSLIFLAIFIFALVKEKNNYKWLIVFSFLIPFTIAVILSFKRSLYLDRYFVFTGLFYSMVIAIFVNSINKKILQNALLVILIIGSILFFAKGWQKIDVSGRPGMAGASKYIFANAAPDEKVYITSSFIFFTYKYYAYRNFYQNGYPSNFNPSEMAIENNVFGDERFHPNYLTPLLYSTGQIPHFSGTALLTDNDLLSDFNKDIRRGENIWVLWTTGFGGSKPEMPKNWKQIDEAGFQDVFGYKGWIVATKFKIQ